MIFIYRKYKESISNKSSIVKERDKLNEEYRMIFEENANGRIDDVDLEQNMYSLEYRIKVLDGILARYFKIELEKRNIEEN